MEVIPAIDIRGGRCVRLAQGDYARETVYADDPAKVARRWQVAGAPRLHVVDLDGARQGRPVNEEAITRLLAAVRIPIQLGGGIRSIEAVERYLAAGVHRVVLGTAAVKDSDLLLEAVSRFPGRIVVGVDARNGLVLTHGWLESSGVAAGEFVRRLSEIGVPRIVYTDVSRDGMLAGPNFDAIAALLAEANNLPFPVKVIASGGVSELEDIRRLAALGVEGAIIGKALYTGAVDLRQAIAAATT